MHHMVPQSGDLGLLFIAALVGGVHCAGMCGPYVSVCSARLAHALPPSARLVWLRVLFNVGRVGTYVALGTLAGGFGSLAGALGRAPGVVSLVAGVLALLAALSLAGVLPALELLMANVGLDRLIRAGSLQAVHAPRVISAIALGGLQGLLPCALVYGAASRAAAAGSAGRGALTMLVFGLGTLPALLALTFAGAAVPRWARSRRSAAILVGLVGVLLVLRGLDGVGAIPHSYLW